MFVNVNWLAVGVSTLAWWILGAVWYAVVFRKPYEAALAFSEEQNQRAQKNFARNLTIHFIGGFLISVMLAHMIALFEAPTLMDGVHTAFGVWMGFAFPLAWITMVFQQRPRTAFLIDVSNWLVGFLVVAVILSVWR